MQGSVQPANPLPQGLTEEQFSLLSSMVRSGAGHLGSDMVVQGSRAAGTARPDSDIDLAIRVPEEQFNNLITQFFGQPNPGTATSRTMEHAIQVGKIRARDAKLSRLRRSVENATGIEVDLSIIRRGGPFDQSPVLPLR